MDEATRSLLDEARGIVACRAFLDRALDEVVGRCIEAGADRSAVAHILGVDRSTLYRRYVWKVELPDVDQRLPHPVAPE